MRTGTSPNLRVWNNKKVIAHLELLFANDEWIDSDRHEAKYPINHNMRLVTVFKHLQRFVRLEIRPQTFCDGIVRGTGSSRRPPPSRSTEDAFISMLDSVSFQEHRAKVREARRPRGPRRSAPAVNPDAPFGSCCGKALVLHKDRWFVYCCTCGSTVALYDPYGYSAQDKRIRNVLAEFLKDNPEHAPAI